MAEYILGIDEAGRGPVLGPMVVAAVVFDKDLEKFMSESGVKDSKAISAKKRLAMYELIQEHASWSCIKVIWPEQIDNSVKEKSLNILECDVMSSIINSCTDFKNLHVCVDSPQTPAVFTNMINTRLHSPENYVIDCRFKADRDIITVAAASILAKVTRDNIIEDLHKDFGDFGSGYPADPKTKSFVQNLKQDNACDFIVRKSWKTYKEQTLWT